MMKDVQVCGKKNRIKAKLLIGVGMVMTQLCVAVLFPSVLKAQSAFTPGNLVVERIGDGWNLTSGAFPISFQEYTTSGSAVQTIWVDSTRCGTCPGTVRPMVESGVSSSDGHITLSGDGRYIVFVGYDTANSGGNPQIAGIVSNSANSITREVGFLNSSGTPSIAAYFANAAGNTGAFKNSNIRGAYYDGATGIWVSGDDGSGNNLSGIHFTTVTNGTAANTAALNVAIITGSKPKNSRGVYVYKNQLYVTTTASPGPGVGSVGSGKPVTAASVSETTLAAGTSLTNPFDAVFLDMSTTNSGPDVLYVTNGGYNPSGTTIQGGGIYKYYNNAGTWTFLDSVQIAGATALVANMNTSGTVDLYVVTQIAGGNSIYKYTDAGAWNANLNLGSATTIATAASNYTFRGLSWAPTQSSPISVYNDVPTNGTTISAGNYGDITIGNGVTATLGGNITVNGTLTVQSGGTLICGTNVISSPVGSYGTFNLQSGGTLQMGNVSGITNYAASGNVQTFSRFYSAGANYVYNGSSAQVSGDGLPVTVNTLTINNAAGVTLTGNLTATNGITMTNGALSNGGNTLTNSSTLSYNGSSTQTVGSEWANSVSNNVSITNTSGVVLGGNITGYTGTITVGSGANFNLGSNTISGSGNISFSSGSILTTANANGVGSSNNAGIQLSGTVSYSSTMSFVLNGGSAQHTGTDMPASVTNFTLNNSHGATLDAALTVTGTCTLTSGTITLGSHKLIIGTSGSISGYNASNYVLINGTGALEMQANTSGVAFPVGDDYNPITILTVGGSGIFDVTLADDITDASNTQITDYAVNRTWAINYVSGTATAFFVTPQWNSTTDLAGAHFDNATAEISSRTSLRSAWLASQTGTNDVSLGGNNYNLQSGSIAIATGNTYYIGVGSGSSGVNPLPVDLMTFNASFQDGAVALKWITASEQNNSYFDIERSLNASTWNKIGSVEGHGTTQLENNYSFMDPLTGIVPSGNIYYRLKQVDFNGKYTYSNIDVLQWGEIQNTVYPNPATSVINLSLVSASREDATLNLIDMNGKLIQSTIQSLIPGNNTMKIDLSNVPYGNYLIKITTHESVKFYRISRVK